MARNNEKNTVAMEFTESVKRNNRRDRITQASSVIIVIALVILFSATNSSFLTLNNIQTILSQIATPLVLAIGLTFVVLTGSIDLSIDGTMGLAGTCVGFLVANNQNDLNLGVLGVILAMMIGAVSGLFIGLVYVKGRIPSFMVSYGVSSVCTGIACSINGAMPATITDPIFRGLALSRFLGLPYVTWIALVLLVVAYIIQERTPFGRYLYAIGINEKIPKSAGVNVEKIKIEAFIWSGICIGLAGVLGAARLGYGTQLIGRGNQFPTLTAVVVGGTLFSGGKGGVINSLFGVLIVTILNNGLILWGVTPEMQQGVQGLIIVVAIALTIMRNRKLIAK